MRGTITIWIARAYYWLTNRPAYLLLVADPASLAMRDARRFRMAWWGLLWQSVMWGIVLAAIWQLAEQFLLEVPGMRIMPAVAAVATMALWPYRRAMAATAETLGGGDSTSRAIVAAVLVAGLSLSLSLAKASWNDIYGWCEWYPYNGTCRALLLMPLWGCWAMLITGQLCRCTCNSEPVIEAFAKGCGPLPAAFSAALPWVGTWFYFKRAAGWWYLGMPAATTIFVIVAGIILCRLAGGLTRRALLTINMLTQVFFLLSYLWLARWN